MKLKKLLATILGVAICFSLICSSASASSTGEITGPIYDVLNTNISTRGATIPTQHYNLGEDNKYTARIVDLAANRGTYTNYYFSTPTGYLYFDIDLIHSGTTTTLYRELTLEIYKLNSDYSGTLVQTWSLHYNGLTMSAYPFFSGFDPHLFYYVLFRNTSSTNANSSMDISGTIVIDDRVT